MSSIVTGQLPADLGTLTLKLYPLGSSAIANGAAGDSATVDATRPGYYEWAVAESLTGIFDAFLSDTAGNLIAAFQVNIVRDNGSRYRLRDGISAQELWEYTTRTLTTAPATIGSVLSGTDISIQRGDSLTLEITGLGDISTRSKLWFTVKRAVEDADASAWVQIEETAGLVYINGSAAGTPANGDITVDNATAGDITIALDAVEVAKLKPRGGLVYDVQVLNADGSVTTLSSGQASVSGDVTRATS